MPFKFYGYDDRSEIMDYTNDGDTVHVEIRKGQDRRRLPYVNIKKFKPTAICNVESTCSFDHGS
jgi:hypothetical protein